MSTTSGVTYPISPPGYKPATKPTDVPASPTSPGKPRVATAQLARHAPNEPHLDPGRDSNAPQVERIISEPVQQLVGPPGPHSLARRTSPNPSANGDVNRLDKGIIIPSSTPEQSSRRSGPSPSSELSRSGIKPAPAPAPAPAAATPDTVVSEKKLVIADQKTAPQPHLGEKQDAEVRRLQGEEPEGTIVEGIEDDELYVLLRGFNKQVNHVLHPATNLPVNEPDLRMTNLPNVPYRSDTLKSNLERLIAGLGPPAIRGTREIARLSDWHNEFYRTSTYCGAYFISWIFGYTVIAITAFFAMLICAPETRRLLFPYRPPPEPEAVAIVDPDLEVSKHAPRTGAEKAEEASIEATSVLMGFISALLFGSKEDGNATVGPKDLVDDWDDPMMIVKDENGKILGYKTTKLDINAKLVEVDGEIIAVRQDRESQMKAQTESERKRELMVTWMAKTTEVTIGIAADFIEIMQKALSPPIIYPDQYARYKLAALLVGPAIAMHYVPAWIFARGATFIFGVVFWGHEWLNKGLRELVRLYPNWKELVDPRNSILSGVPTDAQLTLHLLRVSEAERDPLPVPPVAPALEDTKEAIREVKNEEDKSDTSSQKLPGTVDPAPKGVRKAAKQTRSKTKGVFRKLGRKIAGMGSDVAVVGEERKLRGKIDNLVVKAKWGDDAPEGGYRAKLSGSKGHLFIDEDAECLTWVPLLSKKAEKIWYIDDLVEMKKDGLGVSRLALAAMSGAEIASLGLSLRFAKTAMDVSLQDMTEEEQLMAAQRANETLEFKGVEAREELFNRLVAIGNQRWEML